MTNLPLLYWSRNKDLDAVIQENGYPMERATMLHQADLTREGALCPELVWPHAQKASGKAGYAIVNIEHGPRHDGTACTDPIHYDPRRSSAMQIDRTVQVVNDVMLPWSICAPAMVRTVTLSCNLPYFRTGRDGEAGWRRAADFLTDAGMFSLQTAHFFDVWATDDNPAGAWMVSKGDLPSDEGQFDQAVRLARHLPEMEIICQWAPATRGGPRHPGIAMLPGMLARNIRHNQRKAPHVRPFLWISGVATFDGARGPDGVRTMVDWNPGTPEGDYLVRELECVFTSGQESVIGGTKNHAPEAAS